MLIPPVMHLLCQLLVRSPAIYSCIRWSLKTGGAIEVDILLPACKISFGRASYVFKLLTLVRQFVDASL